MLRSGALLLLSYFAAGCGGGQPSAVDASARDASQPFVAGMTFLDEPPTAIALAPNDELVVSTTTTLRRLARDGSEIWRRALSPQTIQNGGRGTAVRVSASGRIVFHQGEDISVHADDGTVIWTGIVQGVYDIEIGSDDDVYVSDGYGAVLALAATDGTPRTIGFGPLTKASGPIALDHRGNVGFLEYPWTAISRFSSTGAVLATFTAPMAIHDFAFDANDQLVALHHDLPITYIRFDGAGSPSWTASGGLGDGYPNFVLHPAGVFEWRQAMADPTGHLFVNALGPDAGLVWTVERTNAKNVVGACGLAGHCALGAQNIIVSQADRKNWIETFAVP